MYLVRHQTRRGARWALDDNWLPDGFQLGQLLELPRAAVPQFLQLIATDDRAGGLLLAPLEPLHEVWGAGVTYRRSREARRVESGAALGDMYDRVYEAERPELFFKAVGWRVAGHKAPIRIRHDSRWNVPEPELTLIVNCHCEIIGFCIGNDVSSRDIEGENPLYLPQAKIYNGSCALGPCIQLVAPGELRDFSIQIGIMRQAAVVFQGETRTSKMNRQFEDLVLCLYRELVFPQGAFLMTGTGIVPPDDFTMQVGDRVHITIGSLHLENEVSE